ncbi:serine/threonine-protein kinase [Myxococcus sp. MISCRS1]|uniref:serine/threonine-protein kinase n=2 Tax=Myxococcaceae TaxID=31 RepID=UPI0020BF118C|nr:serine/threonine-protein kinase [Myxococcus sp. MISCRS1]MCK8502306.1 serine/threonine protein kinase [Myxococcus fulvus]MCY0997896.1 serine/threonine-protein kinase [Myxococcus sp. MISCRS1]
MEWGGRYRLVRQLAQGGMGEVWEASATGEGGFARRVAIKRLVAEHERDASHARMFLDEARIASRLHHANILSILDYGVTDGLPYQVLEYVDGLDAERLRQRGLAVDESFPVELVLHVCAEVAHALQYAHAAKDEAGQLLQIVHRDVSPSNILVSWTGDVKLADFGIALARDRQERTLAGQTKGKLAYMPPEQLTRGEMDGRSDLFALGCVLHALLTGYSPLAHEDRMADLLAGKELELSDTLPEDVRALVARAVKRSRHQRFQSAAEFAEALGEALTERTGRAGRVLLGDWLARLQEKEAARERPASGWAGSLLEVEQLLDGVVAPTDRSITAVPVPPSPQVEQRARPRWWPWLAVLTLGGLAVAVRPWSAPPPVPAAARPDASPPLERLPPEKREVAAGVAERAPPAPAPAPGETPRAQQTPPKRQPRVQAPSSQGGSGTLTVGGEGALRAVVIIDGERRGHAPLRIELPLGEHVLELETFDGRHLGPERLWLTEFHTPASPLRWVAPASRSAPQTP